MTTTEERLGTRFAVQVRLVFNLDGDVGLGLQIREFIEAFARTQSLFYVASFEDWTYARLDGELDQRAAAFVGQVRVQSVSYNSPLEVVVGISTGVAAMATSAALVANRVKQVFSAYNDIRLKTQATSSRVAALKALHQELGVPDNPPDALEPAMKQLERAAGLIRQLESVDVAEMP
ncbi:hypothetical protein [Nocardioides sp. KR10-350]|uniref:hypothetical protein n=1 Tax=Nocardioides cheoyonin TaxID=3156615 RepID=UPI0032B57EF8